MRRPAWLKVGANCVTRFGEKVKIYEVSAPGEWPIIGRYINSQFPTTWMAGGVSSNRGESASDLVGPWTGKGKKKAYDK